MSKTKTITMTEAEFMEWERLNDRAKQGRNTDGSATWRLWKSIFSRLGIAIEATDKLIPHVRYMSEQNFRLEYADRKVPKRSQGK